MMGVAEKQWGRGCCGSAREDEEVGRRLDEFLWDVFPSCHDGVTNRIWVD